MRARAETRGVARRTTSSALEFIEDNTRRSIREELMQVEKMPALQRFL
jgi:hypothetical protein